MTERTCFAAGCWFAAAAVAAGAFAAHGLGDGASAELFRTASRYQIVHALALIALASPWARRTAGRVAGPAAWAFAAGVVLFSGSLYLLGLGAPRWVGMVTPAGGLAFIAGWCALALGARRTGRG
ncbi:MAG: DUF423 domain-containing protein [Acidobacteria bacterium]|nr:MAG: DUF423 domain-containing protein [Acidobacteriota bacterium]